MIEEVELETEERKEFINITPKIEKIIEQTEKEDGVCHICSPHTTAAITINEGDDPDVRTDLTDSLNELVPELDFKHEEGNSDAHLKCSLVGPTEKVLLEDGEIQLGKWQKIYFCEFDGPRSRKFLVKIMDK